MDAAYPGVGACPDTAVVQSHPFVRGQVSMGSTHVHTPAQPQASRAMRLDYKQNHSP